MAVTAVTLLGLAAGPALAQSPEQLVNQRQENMKQLGGAMKVLSGYVKGEADQAAASKAAQVLVDVGGQMQEWWPEGTAVGVGDSEAKPAIWTETEKFNANIEKMKAATPALLAAVQSSDSGATGKQLGAVGATCKGCHQDYKAD